MSQRSAAHHLVDLLTRADRPYRDLWSARSTRPGDQLDRTAVLRVVAAYEVDDGRIDELQERDRPRRRKDWAARVLGGRRVREVDLALLCDAFDVRADDRADLLDRLQATEDPPPTPLQTVALREEHVIGADRVPVRHRTEQTLLARDGPASEHAFRFDTREADVRMISGGTAGEVVPDPLPGFWRLPITLDTPLAPGELTTLCYETWFSYTEPPPSEFRRTPRPGVAIRISVRFHPAAPPRQVEFCTWRGRGRRPTLSSPEPLVDGGVSRDVTAVDGLVGFRWHW